MLTKKNVNKNSTNSNGDIMQVIVKLTFDSQHWDRDGEHRGEVLRGPPSISLASCTV